MIATLGAAVALAWVAAATLVRLPRAVFLGVMFAAVLLLLPAAAASVLLRAPWRVPALALVMLPALGWGAARAANGEVAAARRLGASRRMIAARLVIPALAPFVILALLLGAGILGLGRLTPGASRALPPISVPYPPEAAG